MFRASALLALAAVVILAASCSEQKVTTYRIPKEPERKTSTPADAVGDMSGAAAVPTATSGLTWTAPAHWTAKAANAMRRGSFTIVGRDGSEADLSITAFPGATGGLLANVNRWRGQIALDPLTAENLPAETQRQHVGPLEMTLVDFSGSMNGAPTRILGAVVPVGNDTWFFKLTGPDAVVAAEKPAFLNFLQTVRTP